MASITKRPDGTRWIQFLNSNGKRQTIRLGKTPAKTVKTICTRIEELLAVQMAGDTMERDLAAWLMNIDAKLHNKLAAVGLCRPRESALLQPFITSHIEGRSDVKAATKEVWRQGEQWLVEFFGPNKPMQEVTPGDADRYKLHLINKLASTTADKRLQFAKTIFRSAVRCRLIAENPFADISIKAIMPNRERFITAYETAKLLTACPNHHWRTIVALARYGGLRCPSEVLSLRWQDIDWEAGRVVITAPKTEHHAGKAIRTIPLFPELRPILAEAFQMAPEGDVYVVDERMRASALSKSGWRNCNLRTMFEKIVNRAGLVPWPRLFHNLRSSRQTELAERFPSHVVCDWMGNSEDIARKHYLQTTDEHFAAAIEESATANQRKAGPIRSGHESTRGAAPIEAKQNPKQLGAALARGESQFNQANVKNADECNSSRYYTNVKLVREGFEPPTKGL